MTPERLVDILASFVKKNVDLFFDCISPDRRQTPKEMSLVRYHRGLHLERFATLYVHITADEARIEVIRGFDSGNKLEDFFLDEKQKEKVRGIAGPLAKRATVVTRDGDER